MKHNKPGDFKTILGKRIVDVETCIPFWDSDAEEEVEPVGAVILDDGTRLIPAPIIGEGFTDDCATLRLREPRRRPPVDPDARVNAAVEVMRRAVQANPSGTILLLKAMSDELFRKAPAAAEDLLALAERLDVRGL